MSESDWLEKTTASMGEAVTKEMLAICQACQIMGCTTFDVGRFCRDALLSRPAADYAGAQLETSNELLDAPPRTVVQSLAANKDAVERLLL